jgi:hypothetical protein
MPEKNTGKLPLLIILDSGGDGLFAVKKVLPAAGLTPCIMVGSDLIKNNFPLFLQAAGILIEEAIRRFPVDPDQVFIAGFSGGARMAFEYARQFPVKGVLMCGAGPSVNSFSNLPCPVYMIAGTTDFNFGEMYYNPLKSKSQGNFLADYFRGGHEWPSAGNLKDGLVFLMCKQNKALLKMQSNRLTEKADSLLSLDETLFSVKAVEKALSFDPANRTARKLDKKIREDRQFARKINKLESDLKLESKIGQAYAQASLMQDSIWWAKEIGQLSKEIAGNQGEKKDHFMRIKAFLGILFFSRINALLSSDADGKQIEHLLSAYRMAEPENPDVYFDYALLEKKHGNLVKSGGYLKKAIDLGFKDKARIEANFPEN